MHLPGSIVHSISRWHLRLTSSMTKVASLLVLIDYDRFDGSNMWISSSMLRKEVWAIGTTRFFLYFWLLDLSKKSSKHFEGWDDKLVSRSLHPELFLLNGCYHVTVRRPVIVQSRVDCHWMRWKFTVWCGHQNRNKDQMTKNKTWVVNMWRTSGSGG